MLKKYIPEFAKKAIRPFVIEYRQMQRRKKLNGVDKIFCISFQRTGTTSTGKFFKDQDFKVATWSVSRKNNWGHNCFIGDYESIFNSKDFEQSQVFEDGPWWYDSFYKILFYRYPKSKFILLERDPDKWFDSMISHSTGRTLGNSHIHSIIYRREEEFYNLNKGLENRYPMIVDNLLPLNEEHREHYINIYKYRNKEIKGFFEILGSSRLFFAQLEDKDLWQKMGDFFNIKVDENYKVHANKTIK